MTTRVIPFPGCRRESDRPPDAASRLPAGVHVAPFVTLLGKRVLLCVARGGVLLAQVAVNDEADESEIRCGMDSLRALYDGDG